MPSFWLRWLSRIGCSTQELVELLYKWFKKEEAHIYTSLSQLGHSKADIASSLEKLKPTSYPHESNQTMYQMNQAQNSGLLETIGQLFNRLSAEGHTQLGQVSKSLKQAGFKASEITQGLRHHYNADVTAVTQALHTAEFSVQDIAKSLQNQYRADAKTVSTAISTIDGDAHSIIQMVQKNYQLGKSEVEKVAKEVWNFPPQEVHKILQSLGMVSQQVEHSYTQTKQNIQSSFQKAKQSFLNLGLHILSPLHGLLHHAQTADNTHTAHDFVQHLLHNSEIAQKLSHLKDQYWNGVVALAHSEGFPVEKKDLVGALAVKQSQPTKPSSPKTQTTNQTVQTQSQTNTVDTNGQTQTADTSTHTQTQTQNQKADTSQQTPPLHTHTQTADTSAHTHTQTQTADTPALTKACLLWSCPKGQALIKPEMHADLHSDILTKMKALNITLIDGQIDTNMVYLKVGYPQGGNIQQLSQQLSNQVSDTMKASYPALATAVGSVSIWNGSSEIFTDLVDASDRIATFKKSLQGHS